MADIRITPASSSMAFTSSLNFKETLTQDPSGSLVLQGSGSTGRTNLFAVDGNNGRLFSIDDDLSDSLFSVNTIAGLPVIEAFADNTVVMGQYGQNVLVVTGSSVGVGTSSPAQKLEVNGNIKLSSTVGSTATPSYIWLGNDYSNGSTRDKLKVYLYNSGTEQYGFSVGAASDIQYHSNGKHDFYIANSSAVRIDSTGVGIGTTSPGSRLHVETPSSNPFRMVRTGDSSYGFELGGGEAGFYNYSTSAYVWLAKANGNVGIGTATPAYKLDVNGNTNITGSLTVTGSLVVNQTATTQSLNTSTRQLWGGGLYYTASLDWNLRNLRDRVGNPALRWSDRQTVDSNNAMSIDWEARRLYTPNITDALNWESALYLNSDVYQRDYKSANLQDAVSSYTYPNTAYFGDIIEANLDSTVTDGMLVYLDAGGTWFPVDQATIGATNLLGLAHNVNQSPEMVLLEGHVVVDDLSSLVATPGAPAAVSASYGGPIYIKDSTTTGKMSTIKPTTTGGTNVVRVLGHCYLQNSTEPFQWMMKFRPSNDWLEI